MRLGAASALVIAALSLPALGGCKQGDGERCLVDTDCSAGLTCNQAQQVCQTPGKAGGIDATVPAVDAPVDTPPSPDAPP